jgi:hypothetical protein
MASIRIPGLTVTPSRACFPYACHIEHWVGPVQIQQSSRIFVT